MTVRQAAAGRVVARSYTALVGVCMPRRSQIFPVAIEMASQGGGTRISTQHELRYLHHTLYSLYITTVDILPIPISDEANQKVILTMLPYCSAETRIHQPAPRTLSYIPSRRYPKKASIAAHQAVAGLTAV